MVPVKRFYKTVSIDASDGNWRVLLDSRPLKTPAGAPLLVASQEMAAAIAGEWEAQHEKIRPDTMPLFRLLATAVDRVEPRRDEIVEATLKYAETDLLCYWAHEPEALVALQAEQWKPVLDWAHADLGAEFRVTRGIVPVDQTPNTLGALRAVIAAFDTMKLTGVSALAGTTGSLVLSLAVAHGRIDADAGGALALLDEQFQADNWGEDAEARMRRERTRAEIAETARFLDLIART